MCELNSHSGFFAYCKNRTHNFIALFKEDWFRTIFCLSLTFFLPEYLAIGSVFLSLLFLVRTIIKEHLTVKLGWLGFLLVLYIIAGLFSSFYAFKPFHSLVMGLLWAAMMIGYFALTTVITDKSRLRITLQTFMLFAFICGCISLLQYVLNLFGLFYNWRNLWYPLDTFLYNLFSPAEFYMDWKGNRPAATFSNPNLYAMEMLPVLPFGLYCLTTASNKNSRILHTILLLVSFVGVLFTFCRSFYFAIIFIIFAFLILTFRKYKMSRWGLLIASLALIVFKLIPNPIWDRFTYIAMEDTSIAKRFDAWIIAVKAFFERPIGGYGIGSLNIKQLLHDYGLNTHHMHNLPFELLAEGGLIAILIFAVMLWFIFIPNFKLYRSGNKADSTLGATLLVTAAGFILFSMAQFPMTTPKSIILFILIYGIFDATAKLNNTSKMFDLRRRSSAK